MATSNLVPQKGRVTTLVRGRDRDIFTVQDNREWKKKKKTPEKVLEPIKSVYVHD